MHWIQTIRDNLALTQEELAHYLQLSTHMIRSVELGRRQLPFNSMAAVIALYNAMTTSEARGFSHDSPQASQPIKRLHKRLHGRCCRKLKHCTGNLKKMQKTYEVARRSLGVYQLLARTLSRAQREGDLARLKWTQQKIKEATQCMNENNTRAQQLLTAEIASLESMKQALEGMPP